MSNVLTFLHGFGARALIVFAIVVALWGTYGYFRHSSVSGGFRSTYLLMAGLTALQGLAGLVLFISGSRPYELLHIVYGIFATLFLPGAYVYSRDGSRRREAFILAGAAWIVAIAYFRGIATG